MILDKNGFLWLSTQDGICRFDGQNFRVFNITNTPSIKSNRFGMMGEMKEGNITIQNYDRYYIVTPFETIQRDTAISNTDYLEKTLGTRHGLTCTSEMPKMNFGHIDSSNFYTVGDTNAYCYSQSSICLAKVRYKGAIPRLVADRKRPLMKVPSNSLWNPIVVGNIFMVYKRGKGWLTFKNGHALDNLPWGKDNQGLSKTLSHLHQNALWMRLEQCTILFLQGNIYQLYLENDIIKSKLLFTGFPIDKKWMTDLTEIVYDNATGNLFLGTFTNGLYILKPTQFHHFSIDPIRPYTQAQIMLDNGDIITRGMRYNVATGMHAALRDTDPLAFFKEENGSVLFSRHDTVFRSDRKFRSFKPLGKLSLFDITYNNEVRAFAQDGSKQLWFCDYYNIGLVLNDMFVFKKRLPLEPSDNIQNLFELSKDTFWVFTQRSLYAYCPRSNIFLTKPLLKDVAVRNAYKARDGSIWVGTYGHGFYKYIDGQFIPLPMDRGNALQNVHSFYEDDKGYFWMPTNNGLFQCKKSDLDDYLAEKIEKPYYYRYQSSDGFATDEFNGGFTPAYIENKGQVLYASIDGIVHFYPDSIFPVLPINSIWIDCINVDGKAIYPGTGSNNQLAPNFNQLSFKVVSPFYGNPENLVLEYKLEGLGNDWFPTVNGQDILFNRLPQGSYTLVVRKQNGFGADNYSYRYFSFVVLPNWYETWWSKLLLLIFINGIIFCLFLLRLKANKRRAAVELLVTEQQLKALRAQISPHFLQNTFAFLAQQMGNAPKEATINSLHQISSYLRHVLYRSDQPVSSLENEFTFIEEYLKMQQILMGLPFEYKFVLSHEIDTYGIMVPTMLMQPLVENALKYGLDYEKNDNLITITTTGDKNYVYCTISDSGNGKQSAPAPKPKGYVSKGLSLTLERMKILYKPMLYQPLVRQSINENGGWDIQLNIPLK